MCSFGAEKIGHRDRTTNGKIPTDWIAIPESLQYFTVYFHKDLVIFTLSKTRQQYL